MLYWFKLVRTSGKGVDWIPYLVDNDCGVGTQVVAGDINGDGLPDIVVGNKKGGICSDPAKANGSREAWEKAQPQPIGK